MMKDQSATFSGDMSNPMPPRLSKTALALAALVVVAALGSARPAKAQGGVAASDWVSTEQTAVRLVSATQATGEGASVFTGLHFRLKEGWKIYWRSPGDAGFPPQLDWAASDNLAFARVDWPAPARFSILGFESMGYKDEVVLPITATLGERGRPLRLRADLKYLTCKDICIPYETKIALDIAAGPPAPSAFAHLINRYAVRVPGDGTGHGLAIERAEVSGGGADRVLRIEASATQTFTAPDLFVEGPEELVFARPDVTTTDDGRQAVLTIAVAGAEDLPGPIAGSRLAFTLVDGERSAERTLSVTQADAGALGAEFFTILALALLGGLILNLMPCVLPVLSIKLLGVVGHGGGERTTVRLSFVASAAGIVFSFLLLAAVLTALKAAGLAVGWGIQFQQPWFLVAMTGVIVLFACNLWGFFAIELPEWIAGADARAGRIRGLGGHFLTGVFATLLATPCSAPFLGTAVGFALSHGPGQIFAVFTTLGVGLALPYLVVAAVPALATALPRPGPWMIVLRRILGFALAATAAWLISALAAEAGMMAAAVIAGLTVVAVGLLYLRHRLAGRPRHAVVAGLAAVALLAFVVPGQSGPIPADPTRNQAEALWVPFDEGAIAGQVAGGKVVFVDVTAEWCITCQINKTLVLYQGEVARRLGGDGVVAMQADWTHPDEAISRYLSGFGRYGIPFDAVYGPGAPRGIPLPELLSAEVVLDAIIRAAGPAATAAASR